DPGPQPQRRRAGGAGRAHRAGRPGPRDRRRHAAGAARRRAVARGRGGRAAGGGVSATVSVAPAAWRATLLVARRELGAYLRAPVAYVVGVLFLAVQGASFAALVSALSDPARMGPLGAVLEGHFGGTLLHWALELAVVALVAMRAVAEDRRAGTWEALVTAPV